MDPTTNFLNNSPDGSDSGICDMDTSCTSSRQLTPTSSTGTLTDSDVEEVDTVSATVTVNGTGTTATVSVDGRGEDMASESHPVDGPPLLCGSRSGSVKVSTFMKKDAPAPSVPIQIQVFVKTIRGNTITCDLTAESLVKELEQAAFHKSGVPVEQQRLNFEGKPLSCPDDRLIKYGIKNYSTVHMMGRLRGGAFTFSYYYRTKDYCHNAMPYMASKVGTLAVVAVGAVETLTYYFGSPF